MSRWLNLDVALYDGVGEYNIPEIEPVDSCNTSTWMGFNYCLSNRKSDKKKKKTGVHFFLADGDFERCWKDPQRYGEMLSAYDCVMSPDFSLFTKFPKAVQIWNHYRKHWLARYWQDMGLTVIPTVSWSDESSFEWCFDGEPKHSVVAVSNVGSARGEKQYRNFMVGYEKMLEVLQPTLVLMFAYKIKDYPGNVRFIQSYFTKSQSVLF